MLGWLYFQADPDAGVLRGAARWGNVGHDPGLAMDFSRSEPRVDHGAGNASPIHKRETRSVETQDAPVPVVSGQWSAGSGEVFSFQGKRERGSGRNSEQ
jgi:hypothetical protein